MILKTTRTVDKMTFKQRLSYRRFLFYCCYQLYVPGGDVHFSAQVQSVLGAEAVDKKREREYILASVVHRDDEVGTVFRYLTP